MAQLMHYRLYNKDGQYLRETFADCYDKAKEILSPESGDKIFAVHDDNHEIECGSAWINDLLDELSSEE